LSPRLIRWAALIAVLTASIEGCGKPVLRVADASLGDYYTSKEFKKLSREQRAEYCAELARQDSLYKGEMLGLNEQLDQSRSHSLTLRAEGDSLFALGTEMEKRGPRSPAPIDVVHSPIYGIRRGESLWSISTHVYGKGTRWRDLYRANRPRIKNPDLIYPGQELSIPR
jgi:nucleoid-associated protein YgaU